MKILHYALGFPPYRSGGLTKFCVDLMVEQAKKGDTVTMLWPGQMKFIDMQVGIKKHCDINIKNQSIQNYEIINPLPISYDEGIANVKAFVQDTKGNAYDKFLEEVNPDVIHIHTLMGIHRRFFETAKRMKIRIVFTAHDFFPICPKVKMFRHGKNCECVQTCEECGICNITALSIFKIKLLQSPVYRRLKEFPLVKKIRKRHRDSYLSEAKDYDLVEPVGCGGDYKELRNYYYSLLKYVDVIHYNSSITKKIYESFFEFSNSCIIGITHSDIKDNRKIKNYVDKELKIRYLGPQSGAKGFQLLKEALDILWKENKKFRLDVHFMPIEMTPYIKVHSSYSYTELEKIFDETDILVAPSIWYETFGYTVLEALSYGVPVIISGNVGAKDILANGAGIIVENINSEKLCESLKKITNEKLIMMNKIIVERQHIMRIEELVVQIEQKCYKG